MKMIEINGEKIHVHKDAHSNINHNINISELR